MKSFAVIGLGLFGTQLAKDLFDAGHTVLAIDSNEEFVEAIADNVSRAVVADAKDRASLSKLGIYKYDCVIVATASDLANSVLITMNLKALNVPEIVCKVQNETDSEVLETLGASFCTIPEIVAADKLTRRLSARNVIDFTQLSDESGIIEMKTPAAWVGKSIVDINIRAKYAVNVVAIRRNNYLHVDLDPKGLLNEDDVLMIIGNNKNLDKVQKVK